MIANFTPISAAIGGALIGLVSRVDDDPDGAHRRDQWHFRRVVDDRRRLFWRVAFIAGLLAAPLIGALAGFPLAAPAMPSSWIVVVVAGLLVGYGTRLGGGCTSGHGICGIARLSPRSIVATLVFMVVAIAVVAIQRHVIGG